MLELLEHSLHSRHGLVRKGAAILLHAPKHIARRRSQPADYLASPPVLANSFPKSGTHLLDQIVAALPGCRNYGAFLSSMTSSFRFRKRTADSIVSLIRRAAPGEIMRAHLFFEQRWLEELDSLNFVHYFIMRDPRDVVVSETHYYRSMNRWHRLHPLFRDAPTLNDAIALAIRGVNCADADVYFPDVGKRFAHYEGWLGRPEVFAIKFEDLLSGAREKRIRDMVAFYIARSGCQAEVDDVARTALDGISPNKSHTFRSGKSGGWRASFTDAHREMFREVAGSVLIKYGFESSDDW